MLRSFPRKRESRAACSVAPGSPLSRGRAAKRTGATSAFGSTRFLNEIDFERHVDYVHFNPVKHKLVRRAREWPYSSFHVYVRRGLLPADWAGDVDEPMMDFGERRG